MKTDLEIQLEKDGIYTVDAVFDIVKGLPLKDMVLVKVYQFGHDKKGWVWKAIFYVNGEIESSIKGYEHTIGSKVANYLKGRDNITNTEGKRMSCTYGRVKEVEKKVRKVIPNFQKIIGSHELLNAMVKVVNK